MTATGDTATSKLELIMGRDGLARLADSTVMVLGVGGVGSNCVEALAEDVPEFLDAYADRVDYVVDAIDTISAKLAVAQYADAHGVRLVSSMGAANKLRPEAFRFADVFDTVNCPLCRIMRKEARKRGIRRLRVLYSCEQPVPVPVREGAERRGRTWAPPRSCRPSWAR